jgi:hypothetical protein
VKIEDNLSCPVGEVIFSPLLREFVINKLPKMTQLFFLLKMLKKASITGYLRLFLAFLKGKRASQMDRLFFTNSLIAC